VSDWKEEQGDSAQHRDEREFIAELSGEYQSTVPKFRIRCEGPIYLDRNQGQKVGRFRAKSNKSFRELSLQAAGTSSRNNRLLSIERHCRYSTPDCMRRGACGFDLRPVSCGFPVTPARPKSANKAPDGHPRTGARSRDGARPTEGRVAWDGPGCVPNDAAPVFEQRNQRGSSLGSAPSARRQQAGCNEGQFPDKKIALRRGRIQ
jgi:hypothetical protein